MQGFRALKETLDVAKRLLRVGTWQSETAAIVEQTAAIEANTAARSTNSAVPPAAPVLAGGGGAAAGGASSLLGGAGIIGGMLAIIGIDILALKRATDKSKSDAQALAQKTGVMTGSALTGGGYQARKQAMKEWSAAQAHTAKGLYDPLIASSHAQTAATTDNTAALKQSTDAAKSLAQTVVDEARAAASKGVQPMSNEEFVKYAATVPTSPGSGAFGPGQNKVKYHKFASGGAGITSGPMLALIGEAGPSRTRSARGTRAATPSRSTSPARTPSRSLTRWKGA